MTEFDTITHLKDKIAHLELELEKCKDLLARCSCRVPLVVTPNTQKTHVHFIEEAPQLSASRKRKSTQVSKRPAKKKSESVGNRFVEHIKAPFATGHSRWSSEGVEPSLEPSEGELSLEPSEGEPSLEPSEDDPGLELSAFTKGTQLAEKTASLVQAAFSIGEVARVQLFYFLSALDVLQKAEVLSSEQVDKLMFKLEQNSDNFYTRNRIRAAASWFHQNIITELHDRGWKLEDAIVVVAKKTPDKPYQYPHIANPANIGDIIDAFQSVKDQTCSTECFEQGFFEYVNQWAPSLSRDRVRAVYYPSTSILEILRVICQSVQNAQYSLLLFAGNKRQRWTSTGDLEEFSLEDLGFDKSIAETLRDTENLDQKLKTLQEEKLIDRHDSEIRVMEHVNLGWEQWRKVLVLVCFYFSGCEYSTQFSGAGNLALPLFKMLIENYSQQDEKERQPVRHLVLPALVQASKFSNLQWKRECISTMEKEGIENMDIYTRTSFISRKAFVSRSSGDWNGSCQLIRDYLRSLEGQEVDQRLYALKGILLCSLGSSLSERGSFDEADGVWRKWYIPGKPLALFPTRVSVKILVASGKANLQRGNYEIARAVLSSAMEQYPADSRQSLDVLTALSDTYCELGNPLTALDTLRKVSELKGLWELKSVSMKDRCLRNKYEMDYYVSYAEALVCAEFHDEAEQLLSELKSYFAQKGRPDTLERYELRRCLRVAIMLAQNLHRRATERVHWEQTEQRWAAVIEIADSFDETSDWDTGIMLLSRHHTSIQLGRDENTWLEKSINKFKADGRFWMRGMGTYWKSFILSKLPQAANVVPRG